MDVKRAGITSAENFIGFFLRKEKAAPWSFFGARIKKAPKSKLCQGAIILKKTINYDGTSLSITPTILTRSLDEDLGLEGTKKPGTNFLLGRPGFPGRG